MEFLVTIAHAIAGGVESPLQLTFQVSTSGVEESMGLEEHFKYYAYRVLQTIQTILLCVWAEPGRLGQH